MSNRRHILKIKNQFQDQMILEIILTTFIFINSLVIVSFVTLESVKDVFELKFMLAMTLAGGELSGLAILYYYTLRQSHRIAGPVYVLEKRLREIGQGDLTGRMRLRKGDYFQDTAELFNETIAGLRARMLTLQETAHALRDKNQNGPSDPALWAELLQQIDNFKVGKQAPEQEQPATPDHVDPAGALPSPRA